MTPCASTPPVLLEGGGVLPTSQDQAYRAKLAAAARLSGVDRYLAYAKLDRELTASAAPWVAFGNSSTYQRFSARVGCVVNTANGADLAAVAAAHTAEAEAFTGR